MEIRLAADLQPDSIVDGEGIRTVVWTQGCPHNCKGCHNPGTHDFNGGFLMDVDEVIEELKNIEGQDGITLSGGDPLYVGNREEVSLLVSEIKSKFPDKNIWCYTGYTWEELMKQVKDDENLKIILNNVDVLLDGRFVLSLALEKLHYVGSSNQRIIDVRSSLDTGNINLYIDNNKLLEGEV